MSTGCGDLQGGWRALCQALPSIHFTDSTRGPEKKQKQDTGHRVRARVWACTCQFFTDRTTGLAGDSCRNLNDLLAF